MLISPFLALSVASAASLPSVSGNARFKLVLGNRAYSSWSLRAWLALHHAAEDFEEVCVELAGAGSDANRETLLKHSPTGKVPALQDRDLRATVWDSLAICEHIAECHPAAGLWPSEPAAKAIARSVAAEMHSGFAALRSAMPMNVRRHSPGMTFSPAVLAEVERIVEIWERCRGQFGTGGPFLFGSFSIADCMYAPIVMRFRTYEPALPPVAAAYCEAVSSWPAVVEWVAAACQEHARIAQYEEVSSGQQVPIPPLKYLGSARLHCQQPPMALSEVGGDDSRALVATLRRSMREYGGIGIAAPQVGLWSRAFVFGVDGSNPRYPAASAIPFQVWINPELTWASAETNWMWEGCLSVPGLRGWVERPRAVGLRGLDEHGTAREVELDGLAARIAQHELDHLDGILFPHRTAGTHFLVPQASMEAQDGWASDWPSPGSRRTGPGQLSEDK